MKPKNEKRRLDQLVVERGLAPSREKARAFIMAGEISIGEVTIDKPGTMVAADSVIVLKARARFVSRGGDKLAGALDAFQFPIPARICADVGASTGGFTDCLLQYGAARVYAIDVGYGQLAYPLRQDSRVILIERTNARYLESLPESVDLVVIDTSFISLKLILPAVQKWLTARADLIALIKPQFEAGRQDVGKGGVVKDVLVHVRVLEEILNFAALSGFQVRGLIRSPLKGPAGNIEFLVWLTWGDDGNTLPYHDLIAAAMIEPISTPDEE
ncbi:MAG: TlyA family RNA methyltransferase [Chloroflexota bacterium]|nr:TlyA family RNA methyltransferase [Chloroflexota bacterium]